jgi:hypothetical protein
MYDQPRLEDLIVRPVCLAQTPNSMRLIKMDVLSEVLRVVRLEGALFFNGEFSAPWCLSEPRSTATAHYLSPEAGHLILYHFLTEGRAYARLLEGDQLVLHVSDQALEYNQTSGISDRVHRSDYCGMKSVPPRVSDRP